MLFCLLVNTIPLQADDAPTVADYPGINRAFSNMQAAAILPADATASAPSAAPTDGDRDSKVPNYSKEQIDKIKLAIKTIDPRSANMASTKNAPAEASGEGISAEETSAYREPTDNPNSEENPNPDAEPPITYPPKGFFKLVSGMFEMQQGSGQPATPPSSRGESIELPRDIGAGIISPVSLGERLTKTEMMHDAPIELANAMARSSTMGGVEVQRRSPVVMDPNIRGFKNNQIYAQANGAYWVPARRDLDTMLSKIDPGMISFVNVTPGPYSVQYGPGLAFIDVEREPIPRHENGYQTQYELDSAIRTNGGQMYGRATAAGGGSDWGFRTSYGERDGSSYRAGDNNLIPSSYHNRDVLGELSYDINRYQHVDFSYVRLDQTDTLYPCQFFDINALSSYGFQSRIVDEDPKAPWERLAIEGWYNHTYFQGDTLQKNNFPTFPTLSRVDFGLDEFFMQPPGSNHLVGTTQGNEASGGSRVVTTLGDKDDTYLNIGVDFRYLEQYIQENYAILRIGNPTLTFGDNMPHSWMLDPGVFVDWTKPLTENWKTTIGSRADFVSTKARASDLRSSTVLPGGAEFLTQNDAIYSFFLNNKFKLNENLTFSAMGGLGQRPASLLDRYSDGLFISSAQSGFTRIFGDPRLRPERDWQIDLGLAADYERCRTRVNLFQAWILDYMTYEDELVVNPNFTDARSLHYINTNLATLTGFDWFSEIDLYPRLSTFAKMSYVQGQDQEINEALPAIPPLDSMIGLRLHDPNKVHRWEFELASRIVDNQNRIGIIRQFGGAVVPLEEPTPGFAVWHVSGYWNYTKNLKLIGGIDNMFNRTYQEHLDLRLSGPAGFPGGTTRVLSPGITPYFAVNLVF
jgi:outer membrane receptor protein involved in Fe transport